MVNGTTPDTAVGTVRVVNERGFRLQEHDSWLNWSKFATDVVMPERGQIVRVTFDKSGFVRACVPVDGAAVTPAQAAPYNAVNGEKQRIITRLAVLKAAAEFAATRSQMKSADVLLVAASWERWVLRDDDAFAVEELP